MAQTRQEYQLLSILSEQLKAKYQELTPEERKAVNKESWWVKNESSLEIVKKMHEILANFKYQPPGQPKNISRVSDSSKSQKKKIKFQVR